MQTSADYVLREANVLDESGGFAGPLDVHVRAGRVAAMGRDLPADGAPEVDCSGLWLLPGMFDCHDHLAFSTTSVEEVLSTPVTSWAL
jgi:dihydroorotase